MTVLSEDSKEIEEEVMAEIKSALNIQEIANNDNHYFDNHDWKPTLIPSPQASATSELTEITEIDDSSEEHPMCDSEVPTKSEASPTRNRTRTVSADGSAMNDSFMDRMNLSCCSSIGGSSTGTFESQKYYIGSICEEHDCENTSFIGSRSHYGTEDLDHNELLEVVRALYKELKKADDSLSNEKKRRHSREKNLIKLAKELKRRKDKTTRLNNKLEEQLEEIRTLKLERELLEQKLKSHKQASSEVRSAFEKQLEKETKAISKKYDIVIAEHEHRIEALNEIHANQCDDLCREVLEANQETMRLQKLLNEATRPRIAVDETQAKNAKKEGATSQKRRHVSLKNMIFSLFALFGGVMLGRELYSFDMVQTTISSFEYRLITIMEQIQSSPVQQPITAEKTEHQQERFGRDFVLYTLE